jgi:hypothetical protein
MIVLVELGTKIQRVDPGIISVHNEEVLRFPKQAVPFYDFSFERGLGNPQLIARRTDDSVGLQQDNPIILPGVFRVDEDEVCRRFSSE